MTNSPIGSGAVTRKGYTPGKLIVSGCTLGCSLNTGNLPAGRAELVVRWFEEGTSIAKVRERLLELGTRASMGAIGRHRQRHLHPIQADPQRIDPDAPKKTELDILDTIIQRGAQQVDLTGTKISAEQLLRAIELKQKLTEGSVFDAMYEAMRGVGGIDLDQPKPPADDPAVEAEAQEGQDAP